MVVGLPLLVAEQEIGVADRELQHIVIGAIGVAVVRRPVEVLEAELAPVDDRVVAGGEDVTVEAGRQGMVGDHLRRLPPPFVRLLLPDGNAEDVVDVAVRVHGGVESGRTPAPDVAVHHRGQRQAAGVDENEAVPGLEGGHVGEGGGEADPVGYLDESADVVNGVHRGGRQLAPPEAIGNRQHVTRHVAPRRRSLDDPDRSPE